MPPSNAAWSLPTLAENMRKQLGGTPVAAAAGIPVLQKLGLPLLKNQDKWGWLRNQTQARGDELERSRDENGAGLDELARLAATIPDDYTKFWKDFIDGLLGSSPSWMLSSDEDSRGRARAGPEREPHWCAEEKHMTVPPAAQCGGDHCAASGIPRFRRCGRRCKRAGVREITTRNGSAARLGAANEINQNHKKISRTSLPNHQATMLKRANSSSEQARS